MENTLEETIESFLGDISKFALEDQNKIMESVNRKVLNVRDRQAQEFEHKAMMIRNSSHELKTKLAYLNHK